MSTFLGRAKTPDIINPADPDGPLIPGPDRYFIETNGEVMTRNLNDDPTLLYYLIKELTARNAELKAVSLDPDPRLPGDALEIAITDADGRKVAEAQVRV